jgi:hypothetical protein
VEATVARLVVVPAEAEAAALTVVEDLAAEVGVVAEVARTAAAVEAVPAEAAEGAPEVEAAEAVITKRPPGAVN